jgi:hypothetical protein
MQVADAGVTDDDDLQMDCQVRSTQTLAALLLVVLAVGGIVLASPVPVSIHEPQWSATWPDAAACRISQTGDGTRVRVDAIHNTPGSFDRFVIRRTFRASRAGAKAFRFTARSDSARTINVLTNLARAPFTNLLPMQPFSITPVRTTFDATFLQPTHEDVLVSIYFNGEDVAFEIEGGLVPLTKSH